MELFEDGVWRGGPFERLVVRVECSAEVVKAQRELSGLHGIAELGLCQDTTGYVGAHALAPRGRA